MELSQPESFGFVLKSLWQSDKGSDLEKCRINILDTICYKDGKPFRWLFTSEKNGEILKKANGKVNTRDIIKYFRQRSAFLKGKKPHYLQSCVAMVYYFETTSSVSCHVIDELKLALLLDSKEALPEILAIQLYIGGWGLKGSGMFEHEWTMKTTDNKTVVESVVNESAILPDLLQVRSLALDADESKKEKLKIVESQGNLIRAMDKRLMAHLEKKFSARIISFTTNYILNSSWIPFLHFVSAITFFDPPQDMVYQRDRLCYFSTSGGTTAPALNTTAMTSTIRPTVNVEDRQQERQDSSSGRKNNVSFKGETHPTQETDKEHCDHQMNSPSHGQSGRYHHTLNVEYDKEMPDHMLFPHRNPLPPSSVAIALRTLSPTKVADDTAGDSMMRSYSERIKTLASSTMVKMPSAPNFGMEAAGETGKRVPTYNLITEATKQHMTYYTQEVREDEAACNLFNGLASRRPISAPKMGQRTLSAPTLRNSSSNKTVANSSYVSNGNVSKEPAFGNRVVRAHCHGDYCGLFFGWDAEVAHAASQKLGSPVRAGKDAPPPINVEKEIEESEFFKSQECPQQLTYKSVLLARSESRCIDLVNAHKYQSKLKKHKTKSNTSAKISSGHIYSKPAVNFNLFRNEINTLRQQTQDRDQMLDIITNHHVSDVADKCYKHVRSLSLMNSNIETSLSRKHNSERNILNIIYRRMVYSDALTQVHPSRFYYNVPVCSVCYKIYTLMDNYREVLILQADDTTNGVKTQPNSVTQSKISSARDNGGQANVKAANNKFNSHKNQINSDIDNDAIRITTVDSNSSIKMKSSVGMNHSNAHTGSKTFIPSMMIQEEDVGASDSSEESDDDEGIDYPEPVEATLTNVPMASRKRGVIMSTTSHHSPVEKFNRRLSAEISSTVIRQTNQPMRGRSSMLEKKEGGVAPAAFRKNHSDDAADVPVAQKLSGPSGLTQRTIRNSMFIKEGEMNRLKVSNTKQVLKGVVQDKPGNYALPSQEQSGNPRTAQWMKLIGNKVEDPVVVLNPVCRRSSSASRTREGSMRGTSSDSRGKEGKVRQFKHGNAKLASELPARPLKSAGDKAATYNPPNANAVRPSSQQAARRSQSDKVLSNSRGRPQSAAAVVTGSSRTKQPAHILPVPGSPASPPSWNKNPVLPYSDIKTRLDPTYSVPSGAWEGLADEDGVVEDNEGDLGNGEPSYWDEDWVSGDAVMGMIKSRSNNRIPHSGGEVDKIQSFQQLNEVPTEEYGMRGNNLYSEFLPMNSNVNTAHQRQDPSVPVYQRKPRHENTHDVSEHRQQFNNTTVAHSSLPTVAPVPFSPAPLLPLLQVQQKTSGHGDNLDTQGIASSGLKNGPATENISLFTKNAPPTNSSNPSSYIPRGPVNPHPNQFQLNLDPYSHSNSRERLGLQMGGELENSPMIVMPQAKDPRAKQPNNTGTGNRPNRGRGGRK